MPRRGISKARFVPDFPKPRPTRMVREEEQEAFLAWRLVHGGSFPEYLVYRELRRQRMEEGRDFIFQANELGGRNRLGGAVIDFELPYLKIAGRVQGEYWHLSSRQAREHDIIQALLLEGKGWTVVDMLAEEVYTRVHHIVGLFLQGEMTQAARNVSR